MYRLGARNLLKSGHLALATVPASSVSFTKNRCGMKRAMRTISRRSQAVSSFREFCLRSRARTWNGSHLLLTDCSAAGIPRRACSAEGGQQTREPAGLKPGAPQASDLPHRVLPQICVEGMEKGGRGPFRFPGLRTLAALLVSFLKTESPMAQHPLLGGWI